MSLIDRQPEDDTGDAYATDDAKSAVPLTNQHDHTGTQMSHTPPGDLLLLQRATGAGTTVKIAANDEVPAVSASQDVVQTRTFAEPFALKALLSTVGIFLVDFAAPLTCAPPVAKPSLLSADELHAHSPTEGVPAMVEPTGKESSVTEQWHGQLARVPASGRGRVAFVLSRAYAVFVLGLLILFWLLNVVFFSRKYGIVNTIADACLYGWPIFSFVACYRYTIQLDGLRHSYRAMQIYLDAEFSLAAKMIQETIGLSVEARQQLLSQQEQYRRARLKSSRAVVLVFQLSAALLVWILWVVINQPVFGNLFSPDTADLDDVWDSTPQPAAAYLIDKTGSLYHLFVLIASFMHLTNILVVFLIVSVAVASDLHRSAWLLRICEDIRSGARSMDWEPFLAAQTASLIQFHRDHQMPFIRRVCIVGAIAMGIFSAVYFALFVGTLGVYPSNIVFLLPALHLLGFAVVSALLQKYEMMMNRLDREIADHFVPRLGSSPDASSHSSSLNMDHRGITRHVSVARSVLFEELASDAQTFTSRGLLSASPSFTLRIPTGGGADQNLTSGSAVELAVLVPQQHSQRAPLVPLSIATHLSPDVVRPTTATPSAMSSPEVSNDNNVSVMDEDGRQLVDSEANLGTADSWSRSGMRMSSDGSRASVDLPTLSRPQSTRSHTAQDNARNRKPPSFSVRATLSFLPQMVTDSILISCGFLAIIALRVNYAYPRCGQKPEDIDFMVIEGGVCSWSERRDRAIESSVTTFVSAIDDASVTRVAKLPLT